MLAVAIDRRKQAREALEAAKADFARISGTIDQVRDVLVRLGDVEHLPATDGSHSMKPVRFPPGRELVKHRAEPGAANDISKDYREIFGVEANDHDRSPQDMRDP
jgi:hypothetical protein